MFPQPRPWRWIGRLQRSSLDEGDQPSDPEPSILRPRGFGEFCCGLVPLPNESFVFASPPLFTSHLPSSKGCSFSRAGREKDAVQKPKTPQSPDNLTPDIWQSNQTLARSTTTLSRDPRLSPRSFAQGQEGRLLQRHESRRCRFRSFFCLFSCLFSLFPSHDPDDTKDGAPCSDYIDLSRVKTISLKPRIYAYEHFLSDEEADQIIELGAQQGLTRSMVAAPPGETAMSTARTSYGTFLNQFVDLLSFLFISIIQFMIPSFHPITSIHRSIH